MFGIMSNKLTVYSPDYLKINILVFKLAGLVSYLKTPTHQGTY